MKFDEALEDISALSLNETVGLSPKVVNTIINKLREEYTPIIKMTKKQHNIFVNWKYHTAGWNMTNCAEWARDENITANNAMQAWLHPETIKIVDE